ncbi:hypothetical protein QTN47_25485 [Danxiaibacter flavus]|uniref:Lipoprotein n=1 Tax=Danxiaibacter flavus TaxID=3049108 RepID=A0ABV3ZLW7_9BACT
MFNFKPTYILTFTFLLTLLSCDRVKKESRSVADKVKHQVAEKKSDLNDKIIAHYDSYHPDTKFNKKRFSEFFMFDPTPDVKNIYCYADEMGIDHDYQFSFNCDTTTINKIVSNLNLKAGIVDDNNGSGLWHDFPWWDSSKIESLIPFSKKGEHETYWYLWYDRPTQKAYYFSFDM